MDWKKIFRRILFPHKIIVFLLTPISVGLLIYSFAFTDTSSIVSYISYFISAYTLLIVSLKIPQIIRWIKTIKKENKYISRWFSDTHYRIKVSLHLSFIINTLYSLLHLGLGYIHQTFWFYSLAGYYIALAFMRFFLLRHTAKHKLGVNVKSALKKQRICGTILLIMNISISIMVFFMVYWNRTFHHNEITTIAIAAYTFSTLTLSIIGIVRYRRTDNPIYFTAKSISLVASSVSVLTLEATMLTTFGTETLKLGERRILLGVSGAVISIFIISMAINLIKRSHNKLKNIKKEAQPH